MKINQRGSVLISGEAKSKALDSRTSTAICSPPRPYPSLFLARVGQNDDSYFRSELRLQLRAMVLSALGLRLTFSRDEPPGALRLQCAHYSWEPRAVSRL